MWVIFFFLLFTGLNLQGIKTSARINGGLALGMGIEIGIFFIAASRYILGHPHDGVSFLTRPLYDPETFKIGSVLSGTSIAVLTYIGFDGISTLSEEAENPLRNILLATPSQFAAYGHADSRKQVGKLVMAPANRSETHQGC